MEQCCMDLAATFKYELCCTSDSKIEEYVTILKQNGYLIKEEEKAKKIWQPDWDKSEPKYKKIKYYVIYIPDVKHLQAISVILGKEIIMGVLDGMAYIEIYDDYRE
jgi:hypothetical protein